MGAGKIVLKQSWKLVIQDMKKRNKLGIKRYGKALKPLNGRDSLNDAYEEVLDLAVYIRNELREKHGK